MCSCDCAHALKLTVSKVKQFGLGKKELVTSLVQFCCSTAITYVTWIEIGIFFLPVTAVENFY